MALIFIFKSTCLLVFCLNVVYLQDFLKYYTKAGRQTEDLEVGSVFTGF